MLSSSQTVPAFVRLAAHPLRWRLLTILAGGDHRVREMAALTGEPQNLVSYHLRLLREGGLVASARSSFDGRDSYYHLDLDRCGQLLAGAGSALHPFLGGAAAARRADPPAPADQLARPATVLFVCTGNSARSAIAAALLGARSAGGVEALSAGVKPKPEMHPHTVRVLAERYGIDVVGQEPRGVDALGDRRFDAVITVCDRAREACPEFSGRPRVIHWSIPDPAAEVGSGEDGYPAFVAVAAELDIRVRHLLPALAATAGPGMLTVADFSLYGCPSE